MTSGGTWAWVALASVLAYLTKLVGHLLPTRWLERPRVAAVFAAMTIGLLSSLVLLNTVGEGRTIVLDARLAAFLVAAVALWRRAPFLLVVVLGALAAAAVRLVG